MNGVLLLLPLALALGAGFLVMFLRAAGQGQFDDLDDPPQRLLKED